jgi:4-aminobutyrate aminotransferase-like enzyme
MLIAREFHEDPQTTAALDQLMKALQRHQAKITGVRPPQAELEQSYAETVAEFGRIRGGNLFFPYLGSGIGRGPLVELADGSIKYDFICGIGVHHFGHSHPEVVRSALLAGMSDTVMQGNLQANEEALRFSRKLLSLANAKGAQFAHCFLSSSGVMAGENALKLAFQKRTPATRVLAFEGCFAGRTMVFSQITDKAAYRQGLPNILPVDYVPFYQSSAPEVSAARALAALKAHLRRYPGQHAAMFFELVQGEGGFYPASGDFHRPLMEACREAGVLVLVDEVQTFARLEQPFAYQLYGLDALIDAVWIGKASQACATLFTADLAPKPGLISQTFLASSSALVSGERILDLLQTGNYFGPEGKIVQLRNRTLELLQGIADRHPAKLAGPWGIGSMIGFTPFGGDAERTGLFIKELYRRGVIAFTAGGQTARGRFLLPVGALEPHHLDEACGIFEETLASIKA